MPEKELFIQTVNMVEVDGSNNIPTAVFYAPDGSVRIGNAAMQEASELNLVNEDFKIDLGRYAPNVQSKRQHQVATGQMKSALQIADDFLYEIQKIAKTWLTGRGIKECKNIVVAEPLSMHTEEISPEWLANYRSAISRVIEGKRILSDTGVTVSFIPEPFAAFQYYRHGIRHPLVTRNAQMNALVLDFGGGTCDVCIIQTTREGEISGGGANKRPLAGKSLPVGGFNVNRALAEHLIRKAPGRNDAHIRTGLHEYKDWHEGRRSTASMDARYRNFIDNFHALVHEVEALKLALSRSVTDWSLTAEQRFSAPIPVPADPFEKNGKVIPSTLSVSELREVFTQKVYLQSLRGFLGERLRAGRLVLEGAPITVVLLSGGSANFGWLQELLARDFAEYLGSAPFVKIPDYQQVVAQGLAVHCAREFETGTSDFRGVTYNPLFLLLDPDGSNCTPRPFVPRTSDLPDVRQQPGLLVPTASMVSSFIDQPMRWRVKLNKAPKHTLDYYFLQSSMDHNDIHNVQNVEEHTLHTPVHSEFDSSLQLELRIRKDGTAVPKFIYRAGSPNSPEIAKEGKKFFIDMTDSTGGGGEAYLGLDFGTSNTAVSYIDRNWVQLIENRGQDSNWRDLGELIELLRRFRLLGLSATTMGLFPSLQASAL